MSAWSGSSSYEQIQRQMGDAVADAGVSAILLDIDSPGGETAGCFDLADFTFSMPKEKPVWAAANDIALSAALEVEERHRIRRPAGSRVRLPGL
jgi:ClpP class serine protease